MKFMHIFKNVKVINNFCEELKVLKIKKKNKTKINITYVCRTVTY